MSFLDIIFGSKNNSHDATVSRNRDKESYAFIDTEVTTDGKKIVDIGALRHDGAVFHKVSHQEL